MHKAKNDRWKNQAIQREYLLKKLKFVSAEDYIFFSDPDEIPNPNFLKNFVLKKKYGIFMQKCFNYKFNLYNKYESPWEGTRVCKKKNLKSIDYMRMKIKTKNLNYPFWRIDKEKSIEVFENSGWHFHNILSAEEFSLEAYSSTKRDRIKVADNFVYENIETKGQWKDSNGQYGLVFCYGNIINENETKY